MADRPHQRHGELAGLTGEGTIRAEDGHHYLLDYTLPEA